MSSTNRGTVRNVNDFYPTPDNTIELIFKEIRWDRVYSFLEPCRGTGAIYDKVSVFMEPGKKDILNRRNKKHAEIMEGIDYLTTPFSITDLAVTNPPFDLAEQFARKSLTEAKCVVYLQRLNWLGSKKRKKFWQDNPPSHVFVLSSRPSFTGGKKTDSCEYAWFCWDNSGEGIMKRERGLYVL